MRSNRRSQCLFGIILIIASTVALHAQTPAPTPTLEREFFKNIWRDQKAIWTAPLHLERSDMKWVVPSGIGFMALVTTDRITGDKIGEAARQVAWSRHISNIGSIYTLSAAAGGLYIIGRGEEN